MVPPHPLHPAHHPHTAMYHHAAAHQQQLNHHQQRGYQGYPQHKQQPRFCGPQPPPHAMQQHPINRAVVAGPHAHPVPNNYHAAAAAARGPSLPPPRHLHPPHPHHRGGCMAPMPHIPPHHPHHHHLHPHHHAYNNNPHRGYNMPPNSYGQQATVPTLPKPPTQPSTTNFTAEIDTSCPPPVPATSTGSALIATMGQPSTASVEAPTNLVPPKYTSAPEQSPTKKMGEPNTISQDNVTAPKLVVGESNHERGMEIDQVADDNDKAVNEDICPPQSPTFAAATAVKPSLAIHTGSELSTIETTTTTQVVAVKSVKKSVSMQQQAKPRIAVMSPITMCFERMLGAGRFFLHMDCLAYMMGRD